MSYYDPFSPAIKATQYQYEMERGFQTLEDKFRQIREINRDIDYLRSENNLHADTELQLVQDEAIRRAATLEPYIPTIYPLEPDAGNPYEVYLAQKKEAQNLRYRLQQEEHGITYAERLGKLERERQQLSRERLGAGFYGAYKSYQKDPQYIAYDEDEALVRKYRDGTRIKQYLDDIETHSHTRRYPESPEAVRRPRNQTYTGGKEQAPFASKYGSAIKDPDYGKSLTKSLYNRSPYYKLANNTFKKDEEPERGNHHLSQEQGRYTYQKPKHEGKEANEGLNRPAFDIPKSSVNPQSSNTQQENEDDILNSKSATFRSDRKSGAGGDQQFKYAGKSNRNLNLSRDKYSSPSFYKNLQARSNSKRSKKNASKSYYKSALERSKSAAESLELDALRKIENRMKLSEIVYEDSKFRNIKHELSHLHMTYDNEVKMRKDIKDKINHHPIILRKHAMVVE